LKRRKDSKALGRALFAIPVVVVVGLVVFGLASAISTQSGTLTVEAVSSGRYSPSVQLKVQVTVGNTTRTTPYNFSLPQGQYNVVFGNEDWYDAPPVHSVSLIGGKTAYVIGTYTPVVKAIQVTSSGFNATTVTAKHGVTPVVWVNEGSAVEVLVVTGIGRIPLEPSQNYTQVFASRGTVEFSILNTSFSGTISCV
jgi:hypothetical protein